MEARKILVVEDESIVARDIEHSLRNLGYEVPAIAYCGEEAIQKAREITPDLILMDIMLKGNLDGVEAVHQVQGMMDVPVIYLTACADRDTLERAKSTEPFGYILKPFEEKELQAAVEMAFYRHNLERKLRENKEWLETTLQNVGHGVIVTDHEGKIILMNSIAEFLTGWAQAEVLSKSWNSALHLMDEQTCETISNILHEPGHGWSATLLSRDGKRIPVIGKVNPIHMGPAAKGRVISFLDITERKHLEQLKDEFVSTVSHELRTPMMIIRESISQILDGLHGETTEKQRNFLSLSLRGIDRLSRIVNDLLDMSKIEAGEIEFKRTRVDFSRLVREVMANFSIAAQQKGIELREKISKTKVPVFMNKDQITQLLTNLIGNAIKFTEKGWIEISIAVQNEVVKCTVKDTGKGISRENLGKVFDKFQQFDRTQGPGEKGTGLGLAICKGIVELHHGKIEVESEPEKGSTFSFYLPCGSLREISREYLKHSLRDAAKFQAPLSIIFFHLKNIDFMRRHLGKRKATFLLYRLEKIIKEVLRRKSDVVLKEAEGLFVLLLSPQEGAQTVMQRLQLAMDHFLTVYDQTHHVVLEHRVMTFSPPHMTSEEFMHHFSLMLEELTPPADFQKKVYRVLAVDDEADTLRLIESRLTANGYQVITASEGETALRLALSEKPDLIILDYMLPKMDGLDICRLLKQDPAHEKIPVILFTAKAQKKDIESGREAGADAYLTKPVDPKTLLKKIQELLMREK